MTESKRGMVKLLPIVPVSVWINSVLYCTSNDTNGNLGNPMMVRQCWERGKFSDWTLPTTILHSHRSEAHQEPNLLSDGSIKSVFTSPYLSQNIFWFQPFGTCAKFPAGLEEWLSC